MQAFDREVDCQGVAYFPAFSNVLCQLMLRGGGVLVCVCVSQLYTLLCAISLSALGIRQQRVRSWRLAVFSCV